MTADKGAAPAAGGPTDPERPSGHEPAPGPVRRAWRAFKHWRRTRPFWGALFVLLGGSEVLLSERAPLPVVIHIGLQGLAGYLIPLVILLLGLLLLFHPVQRTFYSLLAVVLSLCTWITSNLGGFLIGMVLGVLGGSLAFAWQPGKRAESSASRESPRPRRRSSVGLAILRRRGDDAGDRHGATAGLTQPERRGLPDNEHRSSQLTERVISGRGAAAAAFSLAPLALSVVATLGSQFSAVALQPVRPHLAFSRHPTSSPKPSRSVSPSRSPTATSSPSPSPTPSSTPSTSPSPTPSATKSRSASPTPSAKPSPHPRRHVRHAHYSDTSALAATDWGKLAAPLALLQGLSFDGVAKVPTAGGTRLMLKFSMSALTLSGDTMLTVGRGTPSFVMTDGSLFFSGHVQLYTTRLSGSRDGKRFTFTSAKPPLTLAANLTITSIAADHPVIMADSLQASLPTELGLGREKGGSD